VIPLKREINPVFGIVAVVVIVALSAYFLWHAQNEKPAYIGLNAPHPASMVGGKKGASEDLSKASPATMNKMHIPGRSYNPDDPSATSRGGQASNVGNQPGGQ